MHVFRGSGGQIKLLIETKHVEEYWYQRGKILGRLAFYSWVSVAPSFKLELVRFSASKMQPNVSKSCHWLEMVPQD